MKKDDTAVKPRYFCRVYDFFSKYMHEHKSASPHTISTYKDGLKAFGAYIEEERGIPLKNFLFEDATYDFMLDFRNYLHDTKNLAASTCNNRLAANRTYLDYCASRDISLQPIFFAASKVPFYKVPVVHQPIIEEKEALAAMLDAPLNTAKGIRDKTILCILYDGALRVDELVKLKAGDVVSSEDKTKLIIHGKGKKERIVMLDEKTTAWCNQFRNAFHPTIDPICPFFYTVIGGKKKEMTTRNVRYLVKKYANQVRPDHVLPDKVSPHTMRRTRGTLLYRDGVPLEIIAGSFGHADVEVTRAHYAFASEEQMLETARKQTNVIPVVDGEEPTVEEEKQIWPKDMDELKKILGF